MNVLPHMTIMKTRFCLILFYIPHFCGFSSRPVWLEGRIILNLCSIQFFWRARKESGLKPLLSNLAPLQYWGGFEGEGGLSRKFLPSLDLLSIKIPSLVGSKQILKDLRTYNIFLLIHVNI